LKSPRYHSSRPSQPVRRSASAAASRIPRLFSVLDGRLQLFPETTCLVRIADFDRMSKEKALGEDRRPSPIFDCMPFQDRLGGGPVDFGEGLQLVAIVHGTIFVIVPGREGVLRRSSSRAIEPEGCVRASIFNFQVLRLIGARGRRLRAGRYGAVAATDLDRFLFWPGSPEPGHDKGPASTFDCGYSVWKRVAGGRSL
jgi:hypothetical protein